MLPITPAHAQAIIDSHRQWAATHGLSRIRDTLSFLSESDRRMVDAYREKTHPSLLCNEIIAVIAGEIR